MRGILGVLILISAVGIVAVVAPRPAAADPMEAGFIGFDEIKVFGHQTPVLDPITGKIRKYEITDDVRPTVEAVTEAIRSAVKQQLEQIAQADKDWHCVKVVDRHSGLHIGVSAYLTFYPGPPGAPRWEVSTLAIHMFVGGIGTDVMGGGLIVVPSGAAGPEDPPPPTDATAVAAAVAKRISELAQSIAPCKAKAKVQQRVSLVTPLVADEVYRHTMTADLDLSLGEDGSFTATTTPATNLALSESLQAIFRPLGVSFTGIGVLNPQLRMRGHFRADDDNLVFDELRYQDDGWTWTVIGGQTCTVVERRGSSSDTCPFTGVEPDEGAEPILPPWDMTGGTELALVLADGATRALPQPREIAGTPQAALGMVRWDAALTLAYPRLAEGVAAATVGLPLTP